MRGFGSFAGAARFCTAHDELRDHFRARQQPGEAVPLAEQRRIYLERLAEVNAFRQCLRDVSHRPGTIAGTSASPG